MSDLVPLARVYRGDTLESEHWGSYVLVEGDRVLASGGDTERPVFYRSTSKPLQALVIVTSGAADKYGFGDAELALAAGSHSGTPEQVAVAEAMLTKAGLRSDQLGCGAHWPFHKPSAAALRKSHDAPLRVWNNCSGKHAGMLAAARALGTPTETYLDRAHPVQQAIRGHIAECAGVPVEDVGVAVDGCSAPTFAVPLVAMARSLRNLGRPEALPEDLRDAASRVLSASIARPDLIAGPGRFDTELMERTAQPLVAKAGAEGVLGVVLPDVDVALAVKVGDGNMRGYTAFVVALLQRYGWVTPDEADDVRTAMDLLGIRNHEQEVVGTVEPVPPAS